MFSVLFLLLILTSFLFKKSKIKKTPLSRRKTGAFANIAFLFARHCAVQILCLSI